MNHRTHATSPMVARGSRRRLVTLIVSLVLVIASSTCFACKKCGKKGRFCCPAGAAAAGVFSDEAPRGPKPMSLVDLPPVAPPAGTLGETYRLMSYPIDDKEHPRSAALRVAVPPLDFPVRVTVDGLEEEGRLDDEGLWFFQTKPRIPGISNIVRVRLEEVMVVREKVMRYGVEREVEKIKKVRDVDIQYVRLIPGRVVRTDYWVPE